MHAGFMPRMIRFDDVAPDKMIIVIAHFLFSLQSTTFELLFHRDYHIDASPDGRSRQRSICA